MAHFGRDIWLTFGRVAGYRVAQIEPLSAADLVEGGCLVSELAGRLAVLNPHLHEGVSLSEAARRAGVPRRTATRWLAAYQANGLDGLRRLDRVDRGSRRLPREMIELIEGMALRRPPPKAAEVHRAVSGIAAERGWPPVSYPVVRRIIAGLDRGLLALAHGGAHEYRDDFELVLRRESVHPNDMPHSVWLQFGRL